MNGILTRELLTEVDDILKSPPRTLLRARQIASPKIAKDPANDSFRYYWYTPEGSAEVFALGQFASHIPLIGEKGGWITHDGYVISNAYPLSESEIRLIQQGQSSGRGPKIDLQANRVADSGNFIYKKENRVFFLGDPKLGMKGLLNFEETITMDGKSVTMKIHQGDAENGSSSETGDAKKYWKNKNSMEILKDINKGIAKVKSVKVDGEPIFTPNTLGIPDSLSSKFTEPFSPTTPTYSLLKYLQDNRIFENIFFFPEFSKDYTGFSHDCFVVMDNRPEVVQLGMFYDVQQFPEDAQKDGNGNAKIPVRMKTGGCMLYHPSAVYRGNKIGDGTI
ncbi:MULTISPECIES: major capsid family protein [Leptospira]|uniref:PF09950 family protein n=2 Tax=Leptospira TaxID=171 RepID=A0A0E2D5U7_LEPIR|nr:MULTISPECIES: major capsid family protein [Leptospira]EMO61345.1 PF09950 family protein [Leptospira borgpetersenii serovar Pomona str. 200901868]EKO62369.1 PF09950 family protein [Leptospira kirschneri str. H2]EKO86447.1 PF09950 family protein [Leptospira interrogans serovar Grippotyphosa str. Andaman]EKP86723.1 PF09950 family protein [Leptospira interrogans serovar Grippotyphosa str. 2006006986]EKR54949.1 PF09950 family protein [Leptospira interrogans str. UI 12758]